jgi:hypothetical protein
VPPHLEALWRERDLTADRHRAAFTALTREAKLPSPDLAQAVGDRTVHLRRSLTQPQMTHGNTAAARHPAPAFTASAARWDRPDAGQRPRSPSRSVRRGQPGQYSAGSRRCGRQGRTVLPSAESWPGRFKALAPNVER